MSTSRPLVSVIVPVYNGARFVEETLRSVSEQTYTNLQIVVVNDGSTDETPAILERYGRVDPRLKVIHTVNQGLALTRNRGIDESDGELVAFVDADDLWHKDKISRQVHRLFWADAERPTGFVYTFGRMINESGTWEGDCISLPIEGPVLERHLLTNFVSSGSNILARKDLVVAAGKFRNLVVDGLAGGCADYDLQLELAGRYEVGVVREYLVGYRRYPGAMSSQVRKMAASRRLVVERHLDKWPVSRQCRRWARSAVDVVDLGAALRSRDVRSAVGAAMRLALGDPSRLVSELVWRFPLSVLDRLRVQAVKARAVSLVFGDLDPARPMSRQEPNFLTPLMNRRIARLDKSPVNYAKAQEAARSAAGEMPR